MPFIFLCQNYEDGFYHIRSSTVYDKHKFQSTYPKLIIKNIYNINKSILIKAIIADLGKCGHGNSSKVQEKNFDVIDKMIKRYISTSGAVDINVKDESMDIDNDYNMSDEDVLVDI